MKLLTQSATFLNVLPNEICLLKIEIHPVINDKPWFNKSCLKKRKKIHSAKNRYSFVKNKENRDAMKKACKVFKQEKNKSYKNHQQKLEN